MKILRLFTSMLVLLSLTVTSIPVFATEVISIPTAVTENNNSTTRDYSFETLKNRILLGRSSENVEVYDLGIKQYDGDVKNQRILIVQEQNSNISSRADYKYRNVAAVDYWYRGPFTQGHAVADVAVIGYFKYDGTRAITVDSDFYCDIYDSQASFIKRELNTSDGSTAKVDLLYRMSYYTLFDNETVTAKCTKTGAVSGTGTTELI